MSVTRTNQSTSTTVPSPPILEDAVSGARRLMEFCDEFFRSPIPPRDYCRLASAALLKVMHDQFRAALLLVEEQPHLPFPVVTLVRPMYEAALQLFYVLRPDEEAERHKRGQRFLAFEAWEVDEVMRIAGIDPSQFSAVDRQHHERRLELATEVEKDFTPQQRAQMKRQWEQRRWSGVTWTGLSVAGLAREFENEWGVSCHTSWYGIMSKAAHVTPGMIHWSLKLLPQLYLQHPEATREHEKRCIKLSAEWLDRGMKIMVLGCLRFNERYDVLKEEGRTLLHELARPLKDSTEKDQDQGAVCDDPLIRELVERVVNAVHPKRVVLFGSAADGIGPANDFDVLVIVRDGTPVGPVLDSLYRGLGDFPMPVDFLAATEDDVRRSAADGDPMLSAVLAEGREIYRAAENA
jgi:hypothetical protein